MDKTKNGIFRELCYLNMKIPYEVVRSDRRTMAVQIKSDGRVILRAPLGAKEQMIDQFIQNHALWVFGNYRKILNQKKETQAFAWKDGEVLSIRGVPKRLRITVVEGLRKDKVTESDTCLEILTGDSSQGRIKELAAGWMKAAAKEVFSTRTAMWAERMGVTYTKITVRNQSSRWGSCSVKGSLNFNWKLMMVSQAVLDYVIVHELAHRKEMNHSKRFWNVVGQAMPDYEDQRRLLKENESKIISQF